jgi:hypothetical protein
MQPRLTAAQLPVGHTEGEVHGFLVLRSLEGEIIAAGDLTQIARGNRVTIHSTFHFKDGSIQDETTVFSQRGVFRLINDHVVQKGPSFKRPMDVLIDCSSGQVAVRYSDDDGNEKVVSERMKLPPDLANGIVITVMKNIRADAPRTTASMVVATPKPRIVKLVIEREGEESFLIAGAGRKATRYVVKVELGGAAGLVAPLVGKEPPDTRVWIMGGEAPALVKSEGVLFEGGPVWRIELASPTWPEK